MIFKYVLSYDQTKIFGKFKLLKQLMEELQKKRQAMSYVIGGRKASYSIYVWVSIFLYNHTS